MVVTTTDASVLDRELACHGNELRHFVPGAAVKLATVGLRGTSAPLVEEERDTGGNALVADILDPGSIGLALGPDSPPPMTQSIWSSRPAGHRGDVELDRLTLQGRRKAQRDGVQVSIDMGASRSCRRGRRRGRALDAALRRERSELLDRCPPRRACRLDRCSSNRGSRPPGESSISRHRPPRANDLSTAMGTMIAYSNEIHDPAEKQRFLTTMGHLVLQANLTNGSSGKSDESMTGIVALANILRSPAGSALPPA